MRTGHPDHGGVATPALPAAVPAPREAGPPPPPAGQRAAEPVELLEPAASARPGEPVERPEPAEPPARTLDPIARARVRDADTRNRTAVGLLAEGRADEAVALFEQSLASCRSTLGADHVDTLTVAGNLAVARFTAGHRRRGLRQIAANLRDRTRVLGADHPVTLTAQDALAAAHRVVGDADTAVTLAKQVVLSRSRSLGPVHPDTLRSRLGLVLALAATGDITSAHRMLGSTVNDAEERFGAHHDLTRLLVDCAQTHGLLRRQA